MPKPYTFPTLYDDLKTVTISFLTKHGYLKPNQWKSGKISWYSNGNETGSISIWVNTQTESNYIELDYKCKEALINYRVQLVTATSNLGKGVVWYFVCPLTGKRCRKLYLANCHFYHRSAFKSCMYEKQTLSKKSRQFEKTMETLFRTDQLFEHLNKKHFKKQYAGKPTRKYLQITSQIRKIEEMKRIELVKALNW